MRNLKFNELSYIAGGSESSRIATSVIIGLALGAKRAMDLGETDFNGCLTHLTFGVIAGTIGSQTLSYLSEYNDISYEKYQERERVLFV